MNHNKYITKRKKGKHLNIKERAKIELMLKQGKTNQEIADVIGVSKRTIIREKKRGLVKGILNSDLSIRDEYVADYAQKKYDEKQKRKEGNLKIDRNKMLADFLEDQILNKKVSPYVALELAKKAKFRVKFCLKTLYNYIHKEIFFKLSSKNLPYYRKKKKFIYPIKKIRKIGGKSIEERTDIINNREECGHWEMDTVIGKKKTRECLLVLTERKSRKQVIEKINSKSSKSVIAGLLKIFKRYPKTYRERFLSITSDNGSEFMNAAAIEDLGVTYFYAHSYCSWERGTNENNNKLIRRHIPKGIDIKGVSAKEIKRIEKWINEYPRKLFNGKSANEMYKKLYKNYENSLV